MASGEGKTETWRQLAGYSFGPGLCLKLGLHLGSLPPVDMDRLGPMYLPLSITFLILLTSVNALKNLQLGGTGWFMYNGPKNVTLEVATPVYALEALYAAGILKEDPLYR